MNTLAFNPTAATSPKTQPRAISRFLNLAASVVVIAALAVGGWFGALRFNTPETPEPPFAVIASPSASATPFAADAACDVEPLSVDRVMEIVQNPGYFMAKGPLEPPTNQPMPPSPFDTVLWEVEPDLELINGTTVPNQEQFDSATEVANAYLACLVFGTQGQVWTFYSPAHLQQSVLAEFQVFRNEEEIRTRVEKRLDDPAYTGEATWQYLPVIDDIAEVAVNPDRELALHQQSESSAYVYVVMMGVSLEDADGNQIALTNGTGRDLIPNDPMVTGNNSTEVYVTVARLRSGEGWLIIPWPSSAEIGF